MMLACSDIPVHPQAISYHPCPFPPSDPLLPSLETPQGEGWEHLPSAARLPAFKVLVPPGLICRHPGEEQALPCGAAVMIM